MQIKTNWGQFSSVGGDALPGALGGASLDLHVKGNCAVLPRTARASKSLDQGLRLDVGERRENLMCEGSIESFGYLIEIAQHAVRRVSGQDGREEDTFTDPPLGDTNGLFPVDEYFAWTSPRETDESIGRVTLERSIVHRDLAGNELPQNAGPPLSDHSRTRVHVTTPAIVAGGNPPIDPEIIGFQEHETTAASATAERGLAASRPVEKGSALRAPQHERGVVGTHDIDRRVDLLA